MLQRSESTPIRLTEAAIDVELGDSVRSLEFWMLRPRLQRILQRRLADWGGLSAMTLRVRTARSVRTLLSLPTQRTSPATVAWTHFSNGILRIWNSENQRHALGILESDLLSTEPLVEPPVRVRETVRWRRTLRDASSSFGLPVASLDYLADRSAGQLEAARALPGRARPSLIVIASTGAPYARAIIWEARERGIPTAYVPHAPAGLTREDADVPVDHLLTGGRSESEHFVRLGAHRSGLIPIGTPWIPDRAGAQRMSKRRPFIVIAGTSKNRPLPLGSTLDLVCEASSGLPVDIVFSPHPRDRDHRAEVEERGIVFHKGRTADLFVDCALAVVAEAATGAALTAGLRGIPTAYAGGAPGYAFEEQLGTRRLESVGDAREFFEQFRSPRDDLRDHACGWANPIGSAARRRLESVLGGGLESREPVLDSWGALA